MASSRSADRIASVAAGAADVVELWRAVSPLLRQAIPHFEAPCFFTVDPASLLPTSHFQEGLPEIPSEWLGREYAESDFNSMTDVFASASGIGTLHDSTQGRPERATKYHVEMAPFGCDQELLVALRSPDGQAWGMLGLYREKGRPLFSDDELALARSLAPMLADGARRGLLAGQASDPDLPEAPGMVVFDRKFGVVSATATAEGWLAELGGSVAAPPASVLAVAGRVLGPGTATLSRVFSAESRWLAIHGSRLGVDAAVIIDAAKPAHVEPLLFRAFGLTSREQEVTALVLRGHSTSDIAQSLGVAVGTVQAHLTSIFDKTGVRSRRELAGTVFRRLYEPRVRDNERRTGSRLSARGGPFPVG